MLVDYPVAFHRDLDAWLVSPHELATEVLHNPVFSTCFAPAGVAARPPTMTHLVGMSA